MTGRTSKRKISYCEIPNTSCRVDQAKYGYLSADLIGIIKSLLSRNIVDGAARFLREGRYWVPISYSKLCSLLTVEGMPCASLIGIRKAIKNLLSKNVIEAKVFGNCKTGSKQAAANWYSFPAELYVHFLAFLKNKNPSLANEVSSAIKHFEDFTRILSVPVECSSPSYSVSKPKVTDPDTQYQGETPGPDTQYQGETQSTMILSNNVYKEVNNTKGNSPNSTSQLINNTVANALSNELTNSSIIDSIPFQIFKHWNSIDIPGWKHVQHYSQKIEYDIKKALMFTRDADLIIKAIDNYAESLGGRLKKKKFRFFLGVFMANLFSGNFCSAEFLPENYDPGNYLEKSQDEIFDQIYEQATATGQEDLPDFLKIDF